MSDNKKLLELAARAIGKEVWMDCDGNYYSSRIDDDFEIPWNPATNSANSHNLQVKLKISLVSYGKYWKAIKNDLDGECVGYVDPDPKRAVLLVAAELGKLMGGK